MITTHLVPLLIQLKSFYKTLPQTQDIFVNVLAKTMELVQASSVKSKIHGIEKKLTAMALLNKFADEITDHDVQTMFLFQLHSLASDLIDVLVASAKGHLHINVVKQNQKCCSFKLRKPIVEKGVQDVNIETAINQIYNNVMSMIASKQFNASNFITLVTTVIQLLQQIPQLTEAEKKQVAIQVMKQLITQIPIPGITSAEAQTIINTVLSTIIDAIIEAANGNFHIVATVKSWFSHC